MVQTADCISVFVEKLFTLNQKRLFVGAYASAMRRLFSFSGLPPRYVFSEG